MAAAGVLSMNIWLDGRGARCVMLLQGAVCRAGAVVVVLQGAACCGAAVVMLCGDAVCCDAVLLLCDTVCCCYVMPCAAAM